MAGDQEGETFKLISYYTNYSRFQQLRWQYKEIPINILVYGTSLLVIDFMGGGPVIIFWVKGVWTLPELISWENLKSTTGELSSSSTCWTHEHKVILRVEDQCHHT